MIKLLLLQIFSYMTKQIIKPTFILALTMIVACSGPEKNNSQTTDTDKYTIPNPMEGKEVTVQTFLNDSMRDQVNGFGYNIYVDSNLTVRQPNIPAVPGNKGFVSDAEAKRVGEFVALKVKNNIMPPSVSVAELDSLEITY